MVDATKVHQTPASTASVRGKAPSGSAGGGGRREPPIIDATKEIVRGLAGILVSETAMSKVDGIKGVLSYRGYDVYELAKHSSFEETTCLLFDGELPSADTLAAFDKALRAHRTIPASVEQILRALPKTAHPMAQMRTAVSAYGCTDPDADIVTVEAFKTTGTKLIAQMGTIGAAVWRLSQGQAPIAPDPALNYAANFLYMMTGERPSDEATRLMDVALICHADHGIPASTFAAMVTLSSLTDLYSAIAAAIGSLKGPLHGGANEQVLLNLDQIGSANNVPAYMDRVRQEKLKVPGIGHRVYKTYDPRAIIFRDLAEKCAASVPGLAETFATATALEKACVAEFAEKQLYPNVDFFSGIIYRSLGIDPRMFTPIFAIARTAGWVARLVEYLPHNRLFRPKGKYIGKALRPYATMAKR